MTIQERQSFSSGCRKQCFECTRAQAIRATFPKLRIQSPITLKRKIWPTILSNRKRVLPEHLTVSKPEGWCHFCAWVWASMRSKIRSGGACLVLRCSISMCMSGSSQFEVQASYCTDLFVGLVLHQSICRSGIALIRVQVWCCIDLGAGLVLHRSRCRAGIAAI